MRPLTIVNIKLFEVVMVVYKNFIGIDIGKFSFVVAVYNANETNEYEN